MRTLVKLVIAGLVIHATWRTGSAYWTYFSFREGLKLPEALRKYVPEVDQVKSIPVNWAGLNLAEVKRIQNEFRKVFRVD